jgi:hypothetical protein
MQMARVKSFEYPQQKCILTKYNLAIVVGSVGCTTECKMHSFVEANLWNVPVANGEQYKLFPSF